MQTLYWPCSSLQLVGLRETARAAAGSCGPRVWSKHCAHISATIFNNLSTISLVHLVLAGTVGTTVLGLDTVGGGTMKRQSTRTNVVSLHKINQRYKRRKRPACTARLRTFRYLDRLLTPPSRRVTAARIVVWHNDKNQDASVLINIYILVGLKRNSRRVSGR